jgi:hypothetical protein
MDSSVNINHIVNELEKLDYNSKKSILSRLVTLIRKEDKAITASSLVGLRGLGKEVWQKCDTSGYVSSERESWD